MYTGTQVHRYTGTHVHTYIHTDVQTYIRTHVHTYTRTYVHTYIRTYVHTYIWRKHIHLSILIHGPRFCVSGGRGDRTSAMAGAGGKSGTQLGDVASPSLRVGAGAGEDASRARVSRSSSRWLDDSYITVLVRTSRNASDSYITVLVLGV